MLAEFLRWVQAQVAQSTSFNIYQIPEMKGRSVDTIKAFQDFLHAHYFYPEVRLMHYEILSQQEWTEPIAKKAFMALRRAQTLDLNFYEAKRVYRIVRQKLHRHYGKRKVKAWVREDPWKDTSSTL